MSDKRTEAEGYVIQVSELATGQYVAEVVIPVPEAYDPAPTTLLGRGPTKVEAMADLARYLAVNKDHPEAKPRRLDYRAPAPLIRRLLSVMDLMIGAWRAGESWGDDPELARLILDIKRRAIDYLRPKLPEGVPMPEEAA